MPLAIISEEKSVRKVMEKKLMLVVSSEVTGGLWERADAAVSQHRCSAFELPGHYRREANLLWPAQLGCVDKCD